MIFEFIYRVKNRMKIGDPLKVSPVDGSRRYLSLYIA